MADRGGVMDRACQLMIQKYGVEEANLATRTNLLNIPWRVLFALADITDSTDVTGRRDYRIVGEGLGFTPIQVNAMYARRRESSVTMAIFEAASKNGKTFMDLLNIWLKERINRINKIVESWPETKRRSESQTSSQGVSFPTPVETSWNCASSRLSGRSSRSRFFPNIPVEHHSRHHRQPKNIIDDDIESVASQSTNASNENNLSACIEEPQRRQVTQYRLNIESSDSPNPVCPSPWQRIREEGGNIPTFLEQNPSLGNDDPRSLQHETPENPFEDHHLYSAGPSRRFLEDPASRFASVTGGPEPTFDLRVHNPTSASPHGLEQQNPDGAAHCLLNGENGSEMPLNDRSVNLSRNQFTSDWCENNPLTPEEQWQGSRSWISPSIVAPTEPEVQVKEVQVFICGDDNETNRTIVDKIAAEFSQKGVSFVTDEPNGVKGSPRFTQEDRQRITGDSERFIQEVFNNAQFVLLLKSKRFMKYISAASRSKDASIRRHQERLCNIFSWIDEEQRGSNERKGRLLLLETNRKLPPRFYSRLFDCFFKRNED